MPLTDIESPVRVDQVSLRGNGVVILTGPSSCGKGEVAKALCHVMSIPPTSYLAMGDILRNAFTLAKADGAYASLLEKNYNISKKTNILDCTDTTEDLVKKVQSHVPALERHFGRTGMASFTSQLEWLEYCTLHGLLVPNRWTQDFIAAHLEHTADLSQKAFILDGYPRTVKAAEHLLQVLRRLSIPVIKVLHLSISKQEMLSRALQRGRADDDESSLLRRYHFYIENVQPSVDYLKMELGSSSIALIDAHQPVYRSTAQGKVFDLAPSIFNVVASSLRALGVPRVIVRDLMALVQEKE